MIMDYEKKYKEALERAKGLIDFCSDSELKTLENVFPELRESEDERIRKALIEHVKGIYKDPCTEEISKERDMFLAWLEKQGKQKEYTFKSIPRLLDIIEPSDKAKAYCQKLIDTLTNEGYIADAKIVGEVLKGWNGEDVPMAVMDEKKPADKVEPKFRIGDVIEVKPMKCHGKIFTSKPNKIVDITEKSYILDDGKAYNIELQDGWKLSEQKSTEWSEEDEKMIAALNEYVGHLDLIYEKITIGNDDICARDFREKVQEWLKSLKPQLQREWGEEDKEMFDAIIADIQFTQKAHNHEVNQVVYEREIDWLKSLKERYIWKPSEYQLNSLQVAINIIGEQTLTGTDLKELLKQLNKL